METIQDWMGRELVLVCGCELCGKLKPCDTVSDPDGNSFTVCADCNPEMEAA